MQTKHECDPHQHRQDVVNSNQIESPLLYRYEGRSLTARSGDRRRQRDAVASISAEASEILATPRIRGLRR
jgi:hypothetical protein